MNTPNVIEMTDVSWTADSSLILRDIDWSVRQGQHWAIIGLNGSGKTSLLNLVNGYIWPSRGTVSVLGEKFGGYDIRDLRKNIGWVSSSLQERFYAGETAEEIVLSGKYATIGLYERINPEDSRRAAGLLKRLGCGHVAKKPYYTLSQGEKQKVLIARALIHSPKILIFDEPCSGLDVFSRDHLLSYIERIGKKHNSPTIIYVSHRIEEILPIFTHTLLLRRGEVHSQGKTSRMLTSRNLSDFFETPVRVKWQNNKAWLRIEPVSQ
jgi:iron complex transport system ATP-binding protein